MSRIGFVKLLAVLVLTIGSNELWASIVYQYVGNCRAGALPTITAALAATPQPNVVKICPGTYPEQVHITYAVTLQGMTSGNSGEVIIASPPNGLVVNATDDFGEAIAADIFVDVLPAPFTISDITVDAANNHVMPPAYVAGIFVKNSPGTVNHVTTRNQMGGDGGVGIWLEGGALLPAITVENSSIHDFDLYGVWTQTNAAASQLTATISGNDVNGSFPGGPAGTQQTGIVINSGATNTVKGNVVAGLGTGIWSKGSATGTISGNTLLDDSTGILLDAGGVSATGNKIYDTCPGGTSSSCQGIQINSAVPAVQGNTIFNSPVGIEFNCIANPNVHSNTITDGTTGLDQVPAGIASLNSFYDVFTERAGCAAGATH